MSLIFSHFGCALAARAALGTKLNAPLALCVGAALVQSVLVIAVSGLQIGTELKEVIALQLVLVALTLLAPVALKWPDALCQANTWFVAGLSCIAGALAATFVAEVGPVFSVAGISSKQALRLVSGFWLVPGALRYLGARLSGAHSKVAFRAALRNYVPDIRSLINQALRGARSGRTLARRIKDFAVEWLKKFVFWPEGSSSSNSKATEVGGVAVGPDTTTPVTIGPHMKAVEQTLESTTAGHPLQSNIFRSTQ